MNESIEIARGNIIGIENGAFIAKAVPLTQHQEFTAKFMKGVFGLDKDDPAVTAAEIHDMYKPYTMKVEEADGANVIGFKGHPYRLSFIDAEKHIAETHEIRKFDSDVAFKVAVATAVGRLHHFINVRDVETFFETLALAKAYLSNHGVRIPLSKLKSDILRGVVLLHIADSVAGYIEGSLCRGYSTNGEGILDSDSLTKVEPHIPVSIVLDVIGANVDAKLYFHGMREAVRSSTSFHAEYIVYKVAIKERSVSLIEKIRDYSVTISAYRKQDLIQGSKSVLRSGDHEQL